VFTSPVGTFKSNAFGLYDMIGNVLQWCSDSYHDYPHEEVTDPTGGPRVENRILRGGDWYANPRKCRSGQRSEFSPTERMVFAGFRVVMDLSDAAQ
jgi:formylglycine-generating enzyme required for sulfatase activity